MLCWLCGCLMWFKGFEEVTWGGQRISGAYTHTRARACSVCITYSPYLLQTTLGSLLVHHRTSSCLRREIKVVPHHITTSYMTAEGNTTAVKPQGPYKKQNEEIENTRSELVCKEVKGHWSWGVDSQRKIKKYIYIHHQRPSLNIERLYTWLL